LGRFLAVEHIDHSSEYLFFALFFVVSVLYLSLRHDFLSFAVAVAHRSVGSAGVRLRSGLFCNLSDECELVHKNEVDLREITHVDEDIGLDELEAAADNLQFDLELLRQKLEDPFGHVEIGAVFEFECEWDKLLEHLGQDLVDDGVALNSGLEVGDFLVLQDLQKLAQEGSVLFI